MSFMLVFPILHVSGFALVQVVNLFKGENDRVKLMVLYSGDGEDEGLVRAAAGALAMISNDREIAHKIPVVRSV